MALWDKVRQELDRAGKIAQGAIDEGKVRLDAFRARQRADQAAQALGYAVYRARQQGQELDTDTYARLSSTLAGHETEASRLEARLSEIADQRHAATQPADAPTTPADAAASPEPTTPADVSAAASTSTAGERPAPADVASPSETPPAA